MFVSVNVGLDPGELLLLLQVVPDQFLPGLVLGQVLDTEAATLTAMSQVRAPSLAGRQLPDRLPVDVGHVAVRGEADLLDVSLQSVVELPQTETPAGGDPPGWGAAARAAGAGAGLRVRPPGLEPTGPVLLHHSLLRHGAAAPLPLHGGAGGGPARDGGH